MAVSTTAALEVSESALCERLAEVLFTDLTKRGAYVSDASLYRRFPAAVLEARDSADIRDGIALAQLRGWSVTARGGGTSVAGNAIGDGLVIDVSRHMDRILSIDPEAKTARIQPGVVCDSLRDAAAVYGLTYGPDPSTHSRCTVGGMVANNACGSHSVAWGTSATNLVSLKMILANGTEVIATQSGIDHQGIHSELSRLRDTHRATLRTELGQFPRQVSGYGLHYLLEENGFDVARSLAGSEGTLGVITELTVQLVDRPRATALAVLAFPSIFDAASAAPSLRQPGVSTIEGMGGDLLDALRSRPGQQHAGSELPGIRAVEPSCGSDMPTDKSTIARPTGSAGGWLFCEVIGDTIEEAVRLGELLVSETPSAVDSVVVSDPTLTRSLWRIREASAGIATRLPDGGEAWPGWEDSAVPPIHLADYLRDLYELMDSYQIRGIPFGHFGEGCIHIRLSFTPGTHEGVKTFRDFMEEAADLVAKYGGSLSGEHGDGRARSELLPRMYSGDAMAAFRWFKAIFDPKAVINPGVLVDPDAIDDRLRPGPGQRTLELSPVAAFSRDQGSFLNAVNRCVGVGACRSMEGAMCPSFQITRDEVHSTRGRARLLSEMLRGDSIDGGYRSVEVKEALDLCLSCKACANECPVNVDMANYKSEFLHRFYQRRLRPMAHYTMGWLPLLVTIMHRIPGSASVAGGMLKNPVVERMVKRLGGIDTTRPMIQFAPISLQTLFRRRLRALEKLGSRPQQRNLTAERPRVVIWPDTFTNHLDTAPGESAIRVLEALGFSVDMPASAVCCGLTWHSTGQLRMTQHVLTRTLDIMEPYIESGTPIVGLEPSCTAMLRHELPELLPDDPRAARLAELVTSFAQLVFEHIDDTRGQASIDVVSALWRSIDTQAVSQVHCHERAQGDHSPATFLLEQIGVQENRIQTGCCGMAGNWGYEPGHAQMSFDLGERELFPAIRAQGPNGIVLADGFSCRTHVQQGTGVQAVHLAQVLEQALTPDAPGSR